MARIIIASATENGREQFTRLLASADHTVFRCCGSDSELRRALAECGDGILLIAGSLADVRPDDIAGDFGDSFQLLLTGRPRTLDACESPRVFKLAYPCPAGAVLGAVEMLSQLHYMRLPHRTGDEKSIVDAAKRLLMQRYGIDEPTAHRRIQQYAMNHGVRMTEYAAMLLQNSEGTEGS